MQWHNVYRGFLIGASDLIPGVSGGTVALVLGIYDELLAAVGGILSREWRKHAGFLLPLALGVVGALLVFSRAIAYLLERHFVPTQMFFMGLIVGVLPMLWHRSEAPKTFRLPHVVLLAAAALATATTKLVNPDPAVEPMTELSAARAAGLFLSGAAAAFATLLPGISGSFVLLVLGVYPTAIYALATLHVPLIVVIGSGIAVSLLVGSRLIRMTLRRYPTYTYAVIIGLILGSVVVVFPGVGTVGQTIAGIATFAGGCAIAVFFGRHEP